VASSYTQNLNSVAIISISNPAEFIVPTHRSHKNLDVLRLVDK